MNYDKKDILIFSWLTTHEFFTYNEFFDFLISNGYSEKSAKEKIYKIFETSHIKRNGKYYVFTLHS